LMPARLIRHRREPRADPGAGGREGKERYPPCPRHYSSAARPATTIALPHAAPAAPRRASATRVGHPDAFTSSSPTGPAMPSTASWPRRRLAAQPSLTVSPRWMVGEDGRDRDTSQTAGLRARCATRAGAQHLHGPGPGTATGAVNAQFPEPRQVPAEMGVTASTLGPIAPALRAARLWPARCDSSPRRS